MVKPPPPEEQQCRRLLVGYFDDQGTKTKALAIRACNFDLNYSMLEAEDGLEPGEQPEPLNEEGLLYFADRLDFNHFRSLDEAKAHYEAYWKDNGWGPISWEEP